MGLIHAKATFEFNADIGKPIGISVYNFSTPEQLEEFRGAVDRLHRSMMSDEKTISIIPKESKA